jgi:hypothetical protein
MAYHGGPCGLVAYGDGDAHNQVDLALWGWRNLGWGGRRDSRGRSLVLLRLLLLGLRLLMLHLAAIHTLGCLERMKLRFLVNVHGDPLGQAQAKAATDVLGRQGQVGL